MENKKFFFAIIATTFLVILLNFTVPSFAAPTAASVTVGSQETAPTQAAGTVITEGGNITPVNISAYQVTGKWAGFWGNVSGDIRLADSSNNIFYKWTINDPTGGVVYACNGTVSDWSAANLAPLYASDGYLPSFLIQGTDAFNSTFTQQETFISPSLTINAVNYTYTYQGGSLGTDFKTYALRTTAGDVLIWAGKVKASSTSFKNTVADYQILAGVNAQPPATTTFYFYLELP